MNVGSVALVSIASVALMVIATVMVVANFHFIDSMAMMTMVLALGDRAVSLGALAGYLVQWVCLGRRSGRSIGKIPG